MTDAPYFFISPTEHATRSPLAQLARHPHGATSAQAEAFGADVIWLTPAGYAGIQRKTWADFTNSISNGLLAEELLKMRALTPAVLLLEGRPTWTTEGQLADTGYDLSQLTNYLLSLQLTEGVAVSWVDGAHLTNQAVRSIAGWTRKAHHGSLVRRPKAQDAWGNGATLRDIRLHVLQGFPRVGPETAGRILDGVGMPLGLVVAEEDLLEVPGVGPVTVKGIKEVCG